MKNIYKTTVIVLLTLITIHAKAQQSDWCLSEILFQEQAKHDPSLLVNRARLNREIEEYIANHQNERIMGTVRVIPVVFHVIHEGGSENISKVQIQSQIDEMNACYRRLNADTTDTPSPFKPLAGDAEIEFRLAQLDPNGNCTDGITRTFSHLTNDARDNVKALIDWPNNKYLNIWSVKSIDAQGVVGTVLGFATFPGGSSSTDGVELRSDVIGTIGTALTSGWNSGGRAAVHEVGHYLNLYHIWGDDNGACTGSDLVGDTPNQADKNFSTCPTFPKFDTCTPSGDGVMYPDYMDYTQGTCMNMFSVGQDARMNATLSSVTSGRNNLWATANLIATGTNGTPPTTCVPIADFNSSTKYICEGTTLNFTDASWQGDPTSWSWDFPGGTPPNATTPTVSVQYNTPGVYDVTLTVTNSAGSDTKVATGMVVVSANAAAINTYPFQEGFEGATLPNDWYIVSESGSAWAQSNIAAHLGSNSMRLMNYTGNSNGSLDDFITTSFNLTNVSATSMIFWRAFAYRSNSSTDALRVYASTNCGQLWSLRYTKSGTTLGTAGLVSSNFTPTAAQWDADTVNLATSSVSGRPNVRFKFEYEQNSGNNIYIDDINLDGILGVNEQFVQDVKFEVYPNPAHTKAHVAFTLNEKSNVVLNIHDVTGRIVRTMNEKNLTAGPYQYDVDGDLDNGVYFISLTIGDNMSVKKLVLN